MTANETREAVAKAIWNEDREEAEWDELNEHSHAEYRACADAAIDAYLASLPVVPAATKELIELILDAREFIDPEVGFTYKDSHDASQANDMIAQLLAALEALSQTPEQEWEWGVLTEDGEYVPVGDQQWAHNNAQIFDSKVVRRRPASAWLPVEGDE